MATTLKKNQVVIREESNPDHRQLRNHILITNFLYLCLEKRIERYSNGPSDIAKVDLQDENIKKMTTSSDLDLTFFAGIEHSWDGTTASTFFSACDVFVTFKYMILEEFFSDSILNILISIDNKAMLLIVRSRPDNALWWAIAIEGEIC